MGLESSNAACRLDGASKVWAPTWYPAFADHRVLSALIQAAEELAPGQHHIGIEASTDCFREGQNRGEEDVKVPQWLVKQHEELIRLGVSCYSMEASPFFTWGRTHHGGLPAGVVNAVFGNRILDKLVVGAGEELAVRIAIEALVRLQPIFAPDL